MKSLSLILIEVREKCRWMLLRWFFRGKTNSADLSKKVSEGKAFKSLKENLRWTGHRVIQRNLNTEISASHSKKCKLIIKNQTFSVKF